MTNRETSYFTTPAVPGIGETTVVARHTSDVFGNDAVAAAVNQSNISRNNSFAGMEDLKGDEWEELQSRFQAKRAEFEPLWRSLWQEALKQRAKESEQEASTRTDATAIEQQQHQQQAEEEHVLSCCGQGHCTCDFAKSFLPPELLQLLPQENTSASLQSPLAENEQEDVSEADIENSARSNDFHTSTNLDLNKYRVPEENASSSDEDKDDDDDDDEDSREDSENNSNSDDEYSSGDGTVIRSDAPSYWNKYHKPEETASSSDKMGDNDESNSYIDDEYSSSDGTVVPFHVSWGEDVEDHNFSSAPFTEDQDAESTLNISLERFARHQDTEIISTLENNQDIRDETYKASSVPFSVYHDAESATPDNNQGLLNESFAALSKSFSQDQDAEASPDGDQVLHDKMHGASLEQEKKQNDSDLSDMNLPPSNYLFEQRKLAQNTSLSDQSSISRSKGFTQSRKPAPPPTPVIDLVSSSSEGEQDNDDDSLLLSLSNASSSRRPRRRRGMVFTQLRKTIYDDDSSSLDESDQENEWGEELEASQANNDEKDASSSSSIEVLTKKTQQVFIIDSDVDSSTKDDLDEESDDEDFFSDEDSLDSIKHHKRQQHHSKSQYACMSKMAFRRDRERLSQEFLAKFDRKVFDGQLQANTTIVWSAKLRTTAGQTRLQKKRAPNSAEMIRCTVIELSSKVLDDVHRLRSTLLHECCHAAMWLIDGVAKPAHGKCFKKWARQSMKSIPDLIVTTTHNYEIQFKYAWACTTPKCGVVIQRHSRSVDVSKQVCGRCRGRLTEIEVPKKGDISHTPLKKVAPSKYNLFVKEQSVRVRRQLEQSCGTKVTQTQVLKECARLWREKNNACRNI